MAVPNLRPGDLCQVSYEKLREEFGTVQRGIDSGIDNTTP
jgi:hypothetical protein